MNRIYRLFGVFGIFGAILPAGALAACVAFISGFSPVNAFYNELGLFSGGYFTLSLALLVNLSFVIFGLLFGALMLADAFAKDTLSSTVLGFFGALTGVFAMAVGIFTINFTQYHYIVAAAFHISAFVLCALYAVLKLTARGKKPVATIISAVLTCAASGAYAWYIISGGMTTYLVASASAASRAGIEPLALVGWAAIALLMVFTVLFSIGLLATKRKKADAQELLRPDVTDDDDKSLDEVLEEITDEPLEESLGVGLQKSFDESAEDDDSLYGL